MKVKKKLIIGVAIAFLVIAMLVVSLYMHRSKNEFELQTAFVTRDSLTNIVTATGTIQPVLTIMVGTQVSGVILKRYVDYNSVVKKGEVLAELDKRLLEATLRASEADYESKQSQFELQRKNYYRQKELWEKQSISPAAWEQAENTFRTSKLALDSSKAALDLAEINVGYATITSSVDGIVLSRSIEQGQTVASSFNTPTLFTIAKNLTDLWVIANVDETDIGSVKEGQKVKFSVYSYPDDVFDGTVLQVRLNGINTNNVITYEVVIDAPNKDLKLMPGQTANSNIITLEKKDVLLIPLKALRFMPNQNLLNKMGIKVEGQLSGQMPTEKNMHVVWEKIGKNTIRPVLIKTGANNGFDAEVLSGLSEHSEIVLSIQPIVQNAEKGQTINPFVPRRMGGR